MNNDIIITPGTFFDGYITTKYGDPISFEVTVKYHMTELLSDNNTISNEKIEKRISQAKDIVLEKLKKSTISMNYNAIIGFRYDYMSISPSTTFTTRMSHEGYAILVIAQGTPVIVEKESK